MNAPARIEWNGEGEDLRGVAFGALTVEAPAASGPRGVRVLTRCSCGRVAVRHVVDLVSGRARACARCRPEEAERSAPAPKPAKARALVAYFRDAAIVERFEAFVAPEPNTGCWLWTGGTDPEGYGKFAVTNTIAARPKQIHLRAARFALAMALDRWPRADLVVGHRCGVPACVNPDHLFEEPRTALYARRRHATGDHVPPERRPRGARHGMAKLSDEQVGEIRRRRRKGERNVDLAREYGVWPSTIWAIATGRHRRPQRQRRGA